MNKIIIALIFFASAGASAATSRPLCPGNKKLAKDAILASANTRFGGPCKVKGLKKNFAWPSEGREGYGASAECPNTPARRYSVTLKKENNQCRVQIVRLSPLSGSQCGLTDFWGGDEEMGDPGTWQFDSAAQVSLGDLTPEQARALPAIIQEQIVEALAGEAAGDIVAAVEHIKEHSEAGEGYYHQFTYQGQAFDALEYYPGGNSYGTIFKRGSKVPVAKNGDGDISCVE